MKIKCVVRGWLLTGAILPGLVWAGSEVPEEAGAEKTWVPLRPYSVQYLTKNWGMTIKLTRELMLGKDGVWDLKEGGSVLVQKLRQRGRFRIEGATIIPESFTYNLTGAVKRKREVQFSGNGAKVRSLYKGKWYEFPYEPGMLDRQSQQEQMRLYLLNNSGKGGNLVIKVVDGRKTKEYELVFEAEETLQTALGPVKTQRFSRVYKSGDRSTAIWLAPCWDYLMVRTLHIDEGTEVEAVITGGTLEGKPLKEIM